MAGYTRVPQALWDWPVFYRLELRERVVWMALYTSHLAKTSLPGLVRATAVSVAEAARIGHMDAMGALRSLQEAGAIEVDEEARLIRLVELPDRGERPYNGRALSGMWNKWSLLPDSPLKYRWVDTLKWLLGDMNDSHEKVWEETFSTVSVDNIRPSVDNLSPQLSLVNNCGQPVHNHEKENNLGISGREGSVSRNTTNSITGTGIGIGIGISSSRGGAGGRRSPKRARALEPDPTITPADILDTLAATSGGRVEITVWDSRLGERLWELAKECDSQNVTVADVELAGALLAAGYLGYRDDLDAKWVAAPGNLLGVVAKARQWEERGRPAPGRNAQSKGVTTESLVERARRLEAEGQ